MCFKLCSLKTIINFYKKYNLKLVELNGTNKIHCLKAKIPITSKLPEAKAKFSILRILSLLYPELNTLQEESLLTEKKFLNGDRQLQELHKNI